MSHYEPGFEEKELKFQQSLREVQEDAVGKILENGHEFKNYIEVVDNTSGFAKAMREKTLDPTSPKLACKNKCHWCCHQSVSVTAPEVFRISEYIKNTLSKDEFVKKLEELDKNTNGRTTTQRARVNMPCAFLSYGQCQIYDVRPLFCQRQTSYSLADCKKARPKGFPLGSILSEKAHLIAYTGAIEGMYDGLAKVRPDGESMALDLTSATLVALKDDSVSTEWLQGQNSFEGCELNT